MNKCICEWCHGVQNISGKGYCRKHYDQIRKYGYILDKRTRCDDNRILIDGDDAIIIITDKHDNEIARAIVSKSDTQLVKGHSWTLNNNGYVRTFNGTSPVYLHRLLTKCPKGLEVDHINHDKLDNRQSNLRVVKHEVNARNVDAKCVRKITGRKLQKPFVAIVNKDGKHYLCKYFKTEEEAIEAVRVARQEVAELA